MGRRRWRFIAITAFLLVISNDVKCQDENDYYYTPVERSFAQVQPPIFPNNRPSTFFEQGDNYRVPQTNRGQQQLFNEGFRFPTPNYNQHPSPFQLPTGQSQSQGQYQLNQPDYTSQRQRFRQSFPHNYQILPSTRRPDLSQIHSVAYQNDPSKPETFLGQITLNNPDVDFLQSGRYKNTPFDGNSIKPNLYAHSIMTDDDRDKGDLFDHYKVTTYNPNKVFTKQKLNSKSNTALLTPLESNSSDKIETNKYLQPSPSSGNIPIKITLEHNFKPSMLLENRYNQNRRVPTTTESKAVLDIEPLLEEDITDITSFRELMKNTQGSFDVQVIKSTDESKHQTMLDDSNPSASSMNTDNISKEVSFNNEHISSHIDDKVNLSKDIISNNEYKQSHSNNMNISTISEEIDDAEEEEEDDEGEYYDDVESTKSPQFTPREYSTSHSLEIYDDYDNIDDPEQTEDSNTSTPKSFDVLTMKTNNTMVKDDNFKQFVDTAVIDQSEQLKENTTHEINEEPIYSTENISYEDNTSAEKPSILGQEVVSVVTTKSVVNGTISIPDVTYPPSTTEKVLAENNYISKGINDSSLSIPNTTENWIVVASVQTSRSVSGARFLPFPTVEQEEKKQVLTDDDEENVTKDPKTGFTSAEKEYQDSSSTENINDKLDSIQSELSSAVLNGALDTNGKNIARITEPTTENSILSSTSISTSTLNIFTLKNTPATFATERSLPEPLPVMIKKFTPRVTTTSTSTQRSKKIPSLVTVMDDLTGLLPPGYKPRQSYKNKKSGVTTTTKSITSSSTTTMLPPSLTINGELINSTQGRSSGITSKNKVTLTDLRPLLVRKDNKTHLESNPLADLFKTVKEDDLSKFLPPNYKLSEETKNQSGDKLVNIPIKIQKVDISKLLPHDYKESTVKSKINASSSLAIPILKDVLSLLPPGFKLNTSNIETGSDIIETKVVNISSLLPPGYKIGNSNESDLAPSSTPKVNSNSFKVVFPSRPGAKNARKTTTSNPNIGNGPDPVTPKIHKGWPTRASTEFTGWPSPSTTPFSIEKLLEAQRNATATSPKPEIKTEPTTRRSTTTTTTHSPPPSTTPGLCQQQCDIAATIKIVAGVKWLPELLDHNTDEWQNLANEVKQELNSVYSKSDLLNKWYKGVRIDAFSQGSVLVDYFIELNDVEERVDTLKLKKLFHKSLSKAKPGSVVETITEKFEDNFEDDGMLGDQPEEDRIAENKEKNVKTVDKSNGKLEIGKFVMDPAFTEFIVLPKRETPVIAEPEGESFLPQWGIAVIVIALASLLFVVIFGVTVLVNRQKSAKAKQPIPLSEDMLRELDKSHMGGFDDIHQMKERDLPYVPSGKRMSTAFIEQLAYPNPGDSWRSEWTPQMQKYMQHYTPDSGRGSQIYGAAGNAYGYSGSQIYGQTGGGGSQIYGYTGEYPRSHYSRRRSDYDSNF